MSSLPCLNCVIIDGLHLTYGVSSRLTRICLDDEMEYTYPAKDKVLVIPRGTPFSMTSVQIRHIESIFPESKRFWPERWLGPDTRNT
jgi:hypothetical protein